MGRTVGLTGPRGEGDTHRRSVRQSVRHDGHLIQARRGEHVGSLDLQGKEVLRIVYEPIGEYNNDLFSVIIPPKNIRCMGPYGAGLMHRNMRRHLWYDSTEPSLNVEIFQATRGGKVGLYNLEDKKLLASTFNSIYDLYNGVAVVCQNDRMEAIDASGHVIVPIVYNQLWNFLHDMILACHDGKWRVSNKPGCDSLSICDDSNMSVPSFRRIVSA